MLGKDFFVFWQIGRDLLQGVLLYSTPETLYPPAAVYFFVLFGLLPFKLAFGLWSGLNCLLLYKGIKSSVNERPWGWFLYTPILFVLLTGQIDIIFFWISTLLIHQKRWVKVVAAILLTLKPQIAFIVLPWFLLRWVKDEGQNVLYWLAGCLVLHGFPLIFDPFIYQKWISATNTYSGSRMVLSPGLFVLTNFQIPVWFITILSLIVIVFSLRKSQYLSRAAQILALPMGIWYENVLLIGTLSWKIMVPIGWLAFMGAYLTKSSVPFILIPLVNWGVLWYKERHEAAVLRIEPN